MSFILDALKKLEREKESREGGVVMVGPVQWGGPDRSRRRGALGLGLAALMLLAAGAIWWLARPAPESPPLAEEPAGVLAPPTSPEAGAPPTASRPAAEASAPRGLAAPVADVTPPPPRALDVPGERSPTASLAADTDEELPEGSADPGDRDAVGGDEPPPAPEAPPATPAPRFRLTVISERDGEPIALLNDRLVKEGDSFEGVTVIRIGTAEVEIEVDGERQTVGF